MASRCVRSSWPAPALLLCQGGARFECVEDDACELAFEAADCFAAALAFCLLALEVGASGRVVTRLRDRHAVEGRVELAVAAAVEPVTLYAARARYFLGLDMTAEDLLSPGQHPGSEVPAKRGPAHYPRGLFDFVLGVLRWGNRVTACAFVLVTEEYPPFGLRP